MRKRYIAIAILFLFVSCASFQLKRNLFTARNLILKEGGTRNLENAEKILLRLQVEEPNNAEVHNLLGILYYKTNRWEEAKQEFEKAIDLGLNSYEPYYYKGLIYYRSGEYDFARRDLEKAASVADKNNQCIPEIFKVMASIFEIMEKYYGAIAFYKRALSCPMPNKSELERNAFKAEINERLGLISERLAKIAWERGNYEDSDRQAKLAEQYYQKAIKLDPEEPVYYYNLAQLYLWLGRINDAINYYKEAANRANMTGEITIQKEAYYHLGVIYENIGRKINNPSLLRLAISMFESVDSISPGYKHVRCILGELYWLVGEKDRAYNKLSQCCQNNLYEYESNETNQKVCGNIYPQVKREVENKIALSPLQPVKEEFEQPPMETENIGGEVEASVTTNEMTPPEEKQQPAPPKQETPREQQQTPTMTAAITPKKESTTPKVEESTTGTEKPPAPPQVESKVEQQPTPKPAVEKSKETKGTKKEVATSPTPVKKETKPAKPRPTEKVENKENKPVKEKIGKATPAPASKLAMVSRKPSQPSKPVIPEKNPVAEKSKRSGKQPFRSTPLAKSSPRKSSPSPAPVVSDIDASLGDLDQILASQGETVRGENLIIAGVRRRNNVKSLDVRIKIGSGKNVNLKNKIRKIKNQLKFSNGRKAGHLAPEVISRVIASHYGEVRYCYEKQLKMNPELEGKLTVRFTIGLDGHISAAKIEDSSLNNMEVESCVLYKIKNWRFPRPRGGTVTVIFPFIFMGGA